MCVCACAGVWMCGRLCVWVVGVFVAEEEEEEVWVRVSRGGKYLSVLNLGRERSLSSAVVHIRNEL